MKNGMKRIIYPVIMMALAFVFFSSQGIEAEAVGSIPTGGSWNTTAKTQESISNPATVLSGSQTTSSSLNSRGYVPSFGGYIEITKYDSTNFRRLAGAQFTIYDSSGEVVEVITSNAYGVAKSSKLALGVYKVVETKAPDGYELESSPAWITLKSCITVCLKKYNKPGCKGSLNIKKVDEAGNPLAGATFDVFNSAGTKVGTVTTDDNGVAQLGNLSYGNYTLVEVEAPDGYVLDPTPIPITISKNNSTVSISVVNKEKEAETGSLKITHIGQDHENPNSYPNKLEDVVYIITGPDGYSTTVTTNAAGEIDISDLAPGSYTISSVTLTAEQSAYYGGGNTYYEYVDGTTIVNGEFEIKSNEATEIVVKTDHVPR